MTCSPARIEANRRNARKSTGPRTPEGKAASRLNAFRHGMAGAGDLLGPGDRADLVAERAAALADEWGAEGTTGLLLARRAAVLSARMERLAERAEGRAEADYAKAVADFDARRRRSIDCLLAELVHGGERARSAHATLARDPGGLIALVEFADGLAAAIEAGGDGQADARARALAWLGREDGPARADEPQAGSLDDPALLAGLAAEAEAVLARADALEPRRRTIARQRHRVGLDASFDPGTEATHAHRYEAAAERGFFQALRALRALRNGAHAADPTPATTPNAIPESGAGSPGSSNLVPLPEAIPGSQSASRPTPEMGSFRAEVTPSPRGPAGPTLLLPPRPPVDPIAHRRDRPDPRRLVAGRR